MTKQEIGLAMLAVARKDYEKRVVEANDIRSAVSR